MRWCQRLGEAGMKELLAHAIEVAKAMRAGSLQDLGRVIIDSTVQQKAIACPTGSRLIEVARRERWTSQPFVDT